MTTLFQHLIHGRCAFMPAKNLWKASMLASQRRFPCGLILLVAAGLSLAYATSSSAAALAPGGILSPAPSGLPNGGSLIGSDIEPFISPTFTGSLTSLVFQGDPTNPLGGLTFVYQIQNTSTFPGEINRLTVNSFAGFGIDADYSSISGVLAPAYIDRSIGTGDTIGFSFGKFPIGAGSLQPTDISNLLVVYTDAPTFGVTLASVIDGSVAQVNSLAPTRIIPEPSTLVLAGIVVLGGLILRSRRQIST